MRQARPSLATRAPLILVAALAAACSKAPDPAAATALEQRAGISPPAVRPRAVRGSAGGEVAVVGLMVNGPTREDFAGKPQLAFSSSSASVRVALEVSLPSGGIIDMDRERSTLELFRDDRGTDLRGADTMGGPFELMPALAEDGRSLVAIVAGNQLPAHGASRVDLRGSIALITASTEKTHVSSPVELAPGAELRAGPYSFEVTETGSTEWSEEWSFTLETADDLTPVISWRVIDGAGTGHEAEPWMSMRVNSTTRQSLRCEEQQGPVRLEVRAYEDARQVDVPFQAQIGLGLR